MNTTVTIRIADTATLTRRHIAATDQLTRIDGITATADPAAIVEAVRDAWHGTPTARADAERHYGSFPVAAVWSHYLNGYAVTVNGREIGVATPTPVADRDALAAGLGILTDRLIPVPA